MPDKTGYRVQYEVRVTPGRGRGIFALAAIPAGTMVSSDEKDVVFADEAHFRRFLALAPAERYCDILQWSYCERDPTTGRIQVAIGFDDSNFENLTITAVRNRLQLAAPRFSPGSRRRSEERGPKGEAAGVGIGLCGTVSGRGRSC